MNTDKAERQKARERMMLSDPIPQLVLRMAYPTIIAFLINSVYSLADTFFVSSIGTNATAAVSVNSSLDQLIMMMGSVFAIGANSYIARLLGAGNRKRASEVLSTSFFCAGGAGLVLMLIGVPLMHPLVRLLGATPTCEQYAVDYATYVLFAAPFMAANFVMNQCLRSEGSALLSMFGLGFGGILNCILDPIFIFGLNMGVAGASLATALSKLVSFGILIRPYLTGRSMLHLGISRFRPDPSIFKEVLSVGSSSMFRSGLAVFSAILLNKEAGLISDSVLAGIGVSTKIMMFPFSIILGFGSGFQPVSGFNWGARRYDRVRETYRFASRTAFLGSAAMALLIGVFSPVIISWFAGTDPHMQEIGNLCIRVQCAALPVHAWVATVNMLCASLGRAKHALLLATARQGSCFLPILYPLSRFFGAYGVACVQAAADVLTLLLAVPVMRNTKRFIDEAERAQAQKDAMFV